MIRFTAVEAILMLAGRSTATSIALVGVSLGSNGLSVLPGVGLMTGNATLVFQR